MVRLGFVSCSSCRSVTCFVIVVVLPQTPQSQVLLIVMRGSICACVAHCLVQYFCSFAFDHLDIGWNICPQWAHRRGSYLVIWGVVFMGLYPRCSALACAAAVRLPLTYSAPRRELHGLQAGTNSVSSPTRSYGMR